MNSLSFAQVLVCNKIEGRVASLIVLGLTNLTKQFQ